MRARKTRVTVSDWTGMVTLKLGRRKYLESHGGFGRNVAYLKKKFAGCVVDAER